MIGGVNALSSQVANIYNAGSQQLAATLTKLSSGKKFQNASEDLLGFVRSQNLAIDISGYERVKQNLTDAKSITNAAVEAGSAVYEDLLEMKELATQYQNTSDTDEQAEYKAEFDALKKTVKNALENSAVDGTLVTDSSSALRTVYLDPDNNKSLEISFSDVASNTDVDSLNVADTTNSVSDVQNEINSMLTYLSEAKSFDNMTDQQLSLVSTVVQNKESVKSLITDIDEAKEMSNAIDQNIRQQAAISMLSQANMSRQAVTRLYM